MTLIVVLVVLAIVFGVGVGALLEGLAWPLLIALVQVVAAAWFGRQKLRGAFVRPDRPLSS